MSDIYQLHKDVAHAGFLRVISASVRSSTDLISERVDPVRFHGVDAVFHVAGVLAKISRQLVLVGLSSSLQGHDAAFATHSTKFERSSPNISLGPGSCGGLPRLGDRAVGTRKFGYRWAPRIHLEGLFRWRETNLKNGVNSENEFTEIDFEVS